MIFCGCSNLALEFQPFHVTIELLDACRHSFIWAQSLNGTAVGVRKHYICTSLGLVQCVVHSN